MSSVSPKTWQWICRSFSTSPTNGLFKSIFQVTLLYQHDIIMLLVTLLYKLDMLSLLGDLNEHAKAFPVLLMKSLFKTIFQVKLPHQLDEHCLPGDLENECADYCLPQYHQWMSFSRPLSKWNYLFRGFISREIWIVKLHSWVFPRVTDEQLFKTMFQVKLSYRLRALSPGRTEKWICWAESLSVLLTNGFFKTIFWVILLY